MSHHNFTKSWRSSDASPNPVGHTFKRLTSMSAKAIEPRIQTARAVMSTSGVSARTSQMSAASAKHTTYAHQAAMPPSGVARKPPPRPPRSPPPPLPVDENDSPRSNSSNPFSKRPISTISSATSCSDPYLSPLTLAEAVHLWSHASLLFHCQSFLDSLNSLQELLLRPGVPKIFQPRLLINIGIVQFQLGDLRNAAESFYRAAELEAAASPVSTLAMFLLGNAAFATGAKGADRKAQDCFEMCLECFEGQKPAVYDMRELGLNFVLEKFHVVRNRNICTEKISVESRVQMRSQLDWKLHMLPRHVIFEAPGGEHDGWGTDNASSAAGDVSQKSPEEYEQRIRFLIALGDLRLNKPLPPLPGRPGSERRESFSSDGSL